MSAALERVKPSSGPTRQWTGNDDSARNHQGVVPLAESPLVIALSWRESAKHAAKPVGCFRLDLKHLLAEKLIRNEGAGNVRLRFYHDADGAIYLQQNLKSPRLRVGRA